MHFIDTHIHLQDFETEIMQLMRQLKQSGTDKCICVSATEQDWEKVAVLAQKFPQSVIPAFAVHPWYAGNSQPDWKKHLEQMIKDFPSALIGECGFDGIKGPEQSLQEEVFDFHIALADKYRRPLLLHIVKAQNQLSNYRNKIKQPFVFHSFNGSAEFLKQVLKYNGYVAFNAKILQNKKAETIIKAVPENRLLFETDAPYQSNIGDLTLLCEKIAAIRGSGVEETANNVYYNSLRIINL